MKNVFILFAITATLLFSCKEKDIDHTPVVPTCCGKVTAKFNGVEWTAIPRAKRVVDGLPNTVHLIFEHYEKDYLTQELFVLNLPRAKGTFFPSIQNFNMVNDTTLSSKILYEDYDLLLGSYDKTAGRDDFFVVDSFDAATDYFRGRFEMTYLVRNRPFAAAPDTVHLTQGVFEVKGDR